MSGHTFLKLNVLLLCFALFAASGVMAAEDDRDEKIRALEQKISILAEEIESLKLGAVAEPKYSSYTGLGPAASKVYHEEGFSIGGYGEVTYENFLDSSKKDFAEALRFVLYSGYKFNDWVVMNTELEFEHAGIGNVDGRTPEVYVEFSYLDFLLKKDLNFRTGLMLMPMGIVNENHEPTVFRGVKRPDVETNIIPSTWRDMGIMVHGEKNRLSYNAAVVNGLRADRFSKGTWIRNGRQQGAGINASDWGHVFRVKYALNDNLNFGTSYYRSDVSHGKGKDQNPLPKVDEASGDVNLWEINAHYQKENLQLKGLLTRGKLNGNQALQATGAGKRVEGWYSEASYDFAVGEKSGSRMTLTPFFRYEKYDTHSEVFGGARDPQQARTVKTFGVDFKPHANVVLKADYQWRDTESDLAAGKGAGLDENKIDQFNLSLGYIF